MAKPVVPPPPGFVKPTRVLYIRRVPTDFVEQDIIDLCTPFGEVEQVLLLAKQRHGFVQFVDDNAATSCLQHFAEKPYQHAPRKGKEKGSAKGSTEVPLPLEFSYSGREKIAKNPPTRVLAVKVTDVRYPVTEEHVMQIFGRYGRDQRVLMCPPSEEDGFSSITAYVQLDTPQVARLAQEQLDGEYIYTGCNQLSVQFATIQELPTPGYGYNGYGSQPYSYNGAYNGAQYGQYNTGYAQPRSSDLSQSDGPAPVCILHGLHEELTTPEDLAAIFANYGYVVRVKIMYNKRSAGLVQYQTYEQCHEAIQHLNGMVLHGQQVAVDLSKGVAIPPPGTKYHDQDKLTQDFCDRPEYRQPRKSYPPTTRRLHLSNLPTGTSEEQVQEFFAGLDLPGGGEVVKSIRFLDDTHQRALVEFPTAELTIAALVAGNAKEFGGRVVLIHFGGGAGPKGGSKGGKKGQSDSAESVRESMPGE